MEKEYEESNELNELREPAVAYGKQKLTIEEYLEFERASPVDKHEYYKGEGFALFVPGCHTILLLETHWLF